ncbi:MAG TPA: carboxypeptidase-like regulatory domain-containing protein [Saprospiraceae bacterium]|nr:carboxypeptidase-like regulatory domain-containing protein [Saprospiraceae bacterium]
MSISAFRYTMALGLLCLGNLANAQNTVTAKSAPTFQAEAASLAESSIMSFKESGEGADTTKATLRVRILEKGQGNIPVQGATVLLKRDDDKMLGRVTTHDGRCSFNSTPATYTVRVQMTGLKTLEKTGILLDGGAVYDLEIRMAKN